MSPTKKQKSLLETFETLDKNLKIAVANIERPLELSLVTLKIAKDLTKYDRLTAEHIEACLENAGVNLSKKSISKSLSRARDRVKAMAVGPDIYYKIMTKGEIAAEHLLAKGDISLVYISAGTPRTSRRELEGILLSLTGNILICDPYYGHKTFDSLDKIPKACSVKFLSQKTSESGSRLNRTVRAFKKEYPNVELRIADNNAKIHDRFIIDRHSIFVIGHGLKDIGESDSFIIKHDKSVAKDLIQVISSRFDQLWKAAKAL